MAAPEEQAGKLAQFLSRYRKTGPAPILWVGAGASAAAGYPTLAKLAEILRQELSSTETDGYRLVDAYVAEFSSADLEKVLQQHLGAPRSAAPIHGAIARLAGAGVFPILFTTNYDRLLEDALGDEKIPHVVQSLQNNYVLQAMDEVQVLKMHGDLGSWVDVVLTTHSYRDFERSHPLLRNQLDQNLRTHPVVFVGCSMTDPRLLEWLGALPLEERSRLFASRAVLTEDEWNQLPGETRDLLASANVKPVLVPDHAAVTRLFQEVARRLAPLAACDLIFDLEPGDKEWTVVGPTPESPARKAPNPLKDKEVVALLLELRKVVSLAVPLDAPDAKATIAALDGLALRISEKLTPVLLSDAARQEVLRRINEVDHGRPKLVIRVPGRGPVADQALALPWELLAPAAGAFAVRDGRLDVVREAVMDGAPHLYEPTGPLTVAVTISAPEDQTRLDYEKESFRLQGALTSLGQRAAFSDLGGVEDFVEVVKGQRAAAVHFSGHGLPGELVFEDEQGFSQKVPIAELVLQLNFALPEAGAFPRLFFLASCHGATGVALAPAEVSAAAGTREVRGDLAAALGEGPSTAATLHRSGFVQVVGYFGPVGDELCTRAEETFYEALSQGDTTLQAAASARASLREPLKIDGQRIVYPLGWAQLVVYHRGPDHSLALAAEAGRKPLAQRYQRRTVEVSGLPVLETGFVGRRSLQHEIRRRVERKGIRLIVLQGLGGLGKTALASQLLSHTFAPKAEDQLILRGRGLDEEADPIATLRAQAEEHGKVHRLPHWEERLKRLREETPEPASGFAATIEALREDLPGLVLYIDNAESLQDGPTTGDPRAFGSWKPQAQGWWGEVERLSEAGLILVSTRYGWRGLKAESWIVVDPMSPADVLRMLDAFPSFEPLGRKDRERLASRVDGHPRTLEVLDRLVSESMDEQGPGFEVRDPWVDLIEPVLPKQSEEIRADLLLEELWERLTPSAREHAVQLGVLRRPAPRFVVDRVGSSTGELIRMGLLTRFREQVLSKEEVEWVDRWGLHSLVGSFVESKTSEAERRAAHFSAGVAYESWVKEPQARLSDQAEGIDHFHVVGEGDRAWPMVAKVVLWLREWARYQEALLLLGSCEAGGATGERLALALTLQAQMRRKLGDLSFELEQLLERALGLVSSEQSKGDILGEHGGLLVERGEYRDAEDLLRQAVEAKRKSVGVWHLEYGSVLHELAWALTSQGKYREAESLLVHSLEVKKKLLGEWDSSYGASLHHLAIVLSEQGKYEEAEGAIRKSLKVKEATLGAWHHEYASSLHELAHVLTRQGKHGEAENLLLQSLEITEKSLGIWHPSLCMTLMNLAGIFFVQGRAKDSELLLARALEIALRAFGPSHPEVAQILGNRAMMAAALGREEASEMARQALGIFVETLGNEHPMTQEYAAALEAAVAGSNSDTNAQIAFLAGQARDSAIAALRGETDRDALIARIGEVAEKATEGKEEGSSFADLALYLRAVVAILRGEPVPEVPPAYSEHMAAIVTARN